MTSVKTIDELLLDIQNRNIVLPEFQREYVWSLEQSKQLMVSLFKRYPVGALLFWKTTNPPEIKNFAVNREKIGTVTVILDGQQRLTTLYLLIKNEIPSYYTEKDIKNDPRHLYFNLETGEFQYYQPALMRNNPVWVRVVDCFSPDKINVFNIAKQLSKEDEDLYKLAEKLSENLRKLENIRTISIPVENVPSTAGIDEAIDIFDRVNSMGTKLTDAELALTHITAKWPEARRTLKKKIRELENKNFYFDLRFMVRALVGIVKGRGLFETIHKTPAEEVIDGWKKMDKILDYLVTILPRHAYIHSTKDVNTTNVFVPLVVYLSKQKNNTFPDKKSMKNAIRWLYLAHLWGRYTGQTDQRLDHDITLIMRYDNPWQELIDTIIDQRGRIKLETSDLEGRSTQHPIYRMLYILVKSKGAIDWINGAPLDVTHGEAYSIQDHHIFPSDILWGSGKYDRNNHIHKKLVNEIANRAFLTATTNIKSIRRRPPKEYFKEIIERFGDEALEKQLVPTDEDLLDLDNYEKFLKVRREMIAKEINEFIDSFAEKEEEEHKKMSVKDYILLGESSTLEFKSTLRWDLIQNRINKELVKSVIKTIAGFLNSEGGTLLIGVSDDGSIVGIEKDLKTLKRKGLDGFHQLLVHLIRDYIGIEYIQYIKIDFEKLDNRYVCVVTVDASPQPVFVKENNKREFYVRAGNLTKLLDSQETYSYIQTHWQ